MQPVEYNIRRTLEYKLAANLSNKTSHYDFMDTVNYKAPANLKVLHVNRIIQRTHLNAALGIS